MFFSVLNLGILVSERFKNILWCVLLSESEKREHFDLSLRQSFAKNWTIFAVFILLLFSESFSAKAV